MMKRVVWFDPDRWVDADQERDAWLKVAVICIAAFVITVLAVLVGVTFSG